MRRRRELYHNLIWVFFTFEGKFARTNPNKRDPKGGQGVKTLFYQHLRAYIDYYKLDFSIYFWRTVSGVEVDFIVYGEQGLFAFELKSRKTVSSKDFSGLKKFKRDYPIAQCYLVYAGEHKEQFPGELTALLVRNALFELPLILGADSN